MIDWFHKKVFKVLKKIHENKCVTAATLRYEKAFLFNIDISLIFVLKTKTAKVSGVKNTSKHLNYFYVVHMHIFLSVRTHKDLCPHK